MNPLVLILAYGAATAGLVLLVIAIIWVALIRSTHDIDR